MSSANNNPNNGGGGLNVRGYDTNNNADRRSERSPLLGSRSSADYRALQETQLAEEHSERRKRGALAGCVTLLFVLAVVVSWTWFSSSLPKDPLKAANVILEKAPVIDGHIDLPILVRMKYANNVSAVDLNDEMPGHVDIPRLRKGKVGAFFWSVYVECKWDGPWFTKPTYRVRDTLEQIDTARLLIDSYPETFQSALTHADVVQAIRDGKIASLLGVEGAHQLGNSLSVLRQYYALGVRYMTLTHACHNAFADSGGMIHAPDPFHNGLSKIGRTLIYEMNRLGMLVDLSHTSDATAEQAIELSRAPVMWSHSSARGIRDISRNVPDFILQRLGKGENQTDGVVMVNFAPQFIADDEKDATVQAVADHVEHIGKVAGREYVGIGSDFDGIGSTPIGLEDVSKYPDLVAELIKRGWDRQDIAGLAGGNFLRVFKEVERVSWLMYHEGAKPSYELYNKRPDLPKYDWESSDDRDEL